MSVQAPTMTARGESLPEPSGLRQFVQTESAALLRFAWALSGDWASAEDLVQTAIVATWPHWTSLTRADRPELYVRKVIVTTYLRWQRQRWRKEVPTLGLQSEIAHRTDDYAASDTRQALLSVVMRLPAKQRAVVVLRYFADLSEAETAAMLGCAVGTVKRQSHDALARLRNEPDLAAIFSRRAAP
jgi:RNA polymerase sigma-70 factor (sigma-E family)